MRKSRARAEHEADTLFVAEVRPLRNQRYGRYREYVLYKVAGKEPWYCVCLCGFEGRGGGVCYRLVSLDSVCILWE